jgi:hypothetical protein
MVLRYKEGSVIPCRAREMYGLTDRDIKIWQEMIRVSGEIEILDGDIATVYGDTSNYRSPATNLSQKNVHKNMKN